MIKEYKKDTKNKLIYANFRVLIIKFCFIELPFEAFPVFITYEMVLLAYRSLILNKKLK